MFFFIRVETPGDRITRINFDDAFNPNLFRYVVRLVVKNNKAKVLASKSVVENKVVYSFTAEASACVHAVMLG